MPKNNVRSRHLVSLLGCSIILMVASNANAQTSTGIIVESVDDYSPNWL